MAFILVAAVTVVVVVDDVAWRWRRDVAAVGEEKTPRHGAGCGGVSDDDRWTVIMSTMSVALLLLLLR